MRWYAFGSRWSSLEFAGLCKAASKQEAESMARQYARQWDLPSDECMVLGYTAEECLAERVRRGENP